MQIAVIKTYVWHTGRQSWMRAVDPEGAESQTQEKLINVSGVKSISAEANKKEKNVND